MRGDMGLQLGGKRGAYRCGSRHAVCRLTPFLPIFLQQLIKKPYYKLQLMFLESSLTANEELTQIQFNTVHYQLKDEPFIVPANFKRDVPLNKNIFELKQDEPRNYVKKKGTEQISEMAMLDPLQMSVASIKLLMAQKSLAYTAVFSILVSIYDVYSQDEQELEWYVHGLTFGMTLIMAILVVAAAVFHSQNIAARRMNQQFFLGRHLLKFVMVLLSPNPWSHNIDLSLHLILLLRLYFPIVYVIRSSIYYQSRAARIINIYGMKPQFTFQFAWKVILDNMSISLVLIFYIGVVLFYSHCLFLVSDDLAYIDCFQIVMVTLPTVGYGDYQVTGDGPRTIILCVLVTGIALNAFITLAVLKQFEMSSGQNNSYILMQKLNMVEDIQTLSSEFIRRKFRNKKANQTAQKQQDECFKQKYKQCRTRYSNLQPHDSVSQFTYFRDMLIELKIKIQQANNMITVLLSRLATSARPSRPQSPNKKQ